MLSVKCFCFTRFYRCLYGCIYLDNVLSARGRSITTPHFSPTARFFLHNSRKSPLFAQEKGLHCQRIANLLERKIIIVMKRIFNRIKKAYYRLFYSQFCWICNPPASNISICNANHLRSNKRSHYLCQVIARQQASNSLVVAPC